MYVSGLQRPNGSVDREIVVHRLYADNPNQSPPTTQRTSQPQPAPLTPAWTPASPAPASAQPSLPDADAQDFLNFPGARCNYTNPAVAIARTAQSAVVIWQNGVGRFYYKGFGLKNGSSVEIDDRCSGDRRWGAE